MNISDVRELLAAGFSHDEIIALINPQNPQNNSQEEQTAVQSDSTDTDVKPTAVPEPAAAAENKPESDLELFQHAIRDMIASNKELMQTIQASNLHNDSHGSNSIDDITTKAENALRSIIRPEKGEN